MHRAESQPRLEFKATQPCRERLQHSGRRKARAVPHRGGEPMLRSSRQGARARLAEVARIVALVAAAPIMAAAQPTDGPPILHARVIAVGIPGAGAVSAVGSFHAGGPIHDKPAFAAFTEPTRIL